MVWVSEFFEGRAMSQVSRDERAEAAIKSAIRETFADVAIESIDVRPVEDYNGDAAFSVTIFLKAALQRMSGSRLLDAITAAATALRELDDPRFPYVTFLAPDYEHAEDTRPAA